MVNDGILARWSLIRIDAVGFKVMYKYRIDSTTEKLSLSMRLPAFIHRSSLDGSSSRLSQPSLRAVNTAAVREVTRSFLKMLTRCV